MNPQDWTRVEPLYYAALERQPESRAAFLDEACAGNEELRREVDSLLLSAAQAGTFLATPVMEAVARVFHGEPRLTSVGRQIGHYRVLSFLGAGGMGEVYLAHDMQLRREVALKLLPMELTVDAGRVRRFAQEARAASALNHPNIITIHEIGEVDGTHYIVTEYIEGQTLRQRIIDSPQQRLTPVDALEFAVQIAAALSVAHRRGITHRDIKPENVMVRDDGIVKVLDFGLAKLTEPEPPVAPLRDKVQDKNSSDSGMVMGTLRYMSPEQARGEKVDARTDIFSLGVVLYQMIAGCTPFVGATGNETMAAILRDEPLPLTGHAPATPGELDRIVSRALRKSPAERYQSAKDLLADLKELKQHLELHQRLGEMGSALRPLGEAPGDRDTRVEGHAAHKPFALFAPALRSSIAAWVSRNRQPVLTEKDLVLLADFENKTADAVFDATLKQALAIQLRQSPFLSLFSDERVRQTLQMMKRSPDEQVTTKVGREICIRHNLKALIAGSIVGLGSHYVITLEAIHGQNGEVLENEQIEADSKEHVLRALSQAATRLRAKLGESLSSIQRFDKGWEETTTEKLEAFQAYALGYEQTLRGRLIDAIQLYGRAVELDPYFAYAWSMLSAHHNACGRPGLAAEHAEKAYDLKDRVSDYEQLAITFRYHFIATGDMNKAIDAATLFKRTYPRTSTAPIDLSVAYDLTGQHELAVAEGREAVRVDPNYWPAYWYLGRVLLRVNRYAEAKDIFNQALEQKFDMTNIHTGLYSIAFAENDAAGIQQQLDWAKGKPDEYVALDWQAGAAGFAGQWRKAQDLSRRSIDMAGRGDAKEVAARYATEQALRGVALEDYPRAKSAAARALEIASGRASVPRAALTLALCGESTQVKALTDELARLYPQDTVINSIWLPIIRAALDLRSGNAAEAISQLESTTIYEAAAEFWPQYLRGQAFLKLHRGEEAGTEFQKILDHRGQAPLSPLYPLAYLGLARATAMIDDAAGSGKAMKEFLAAWHNAYADLPILIAAKKELETQ